MPQQATHGSAGVLTIVGTGYLVGGQMTPQAQTHLENADRLFHLAGDPVTEMWIKGLNPQAEALTDLYQPGKPRRRTYREMTERILVPVRRGERVCAAFYGHPGVGVRAAHQAVRQAREEGHRAHMLPGISAEDCLYADLGVDPVEDGCQSFEATDFLLRGRCPDPSVPLILWQIGAIGITDYQQAWTWDQRRLQILVEVLGRSYPPQHSCVVYEASMLPVCEPLRQRVPLDKLSQVEVSTASTLYVPPRERAPKDPEMMKRLGLESR